ncbi:MAG: DUF362 domain-containing protein [Isosphaeraceae bacterium]|nr:DUF362 domain-containing protein [Isosphaeraceae bacterium]
MDARDRPRVAVVRADRRRAAVAEALHLIADDLRVAVRGEVVLKPNLVSSRRQLASTHADALSATLDALFAAGAAEITVAEGATDASAGFERFGLRREAFGRPVQFLDINRDEHDWESLILHRADGSPTSARLSSTIARAGCRVSLALMKTHVISHATFGLKNMLSSIHPEDRPLMHGNPAGGNGFRGWRRHAVEFLKGDSWLVNRLTRAMGRARRFKHALRRLDREDGVARFSAADRAFRRGAETLDRNLATLATRTKPHVTVLDGFEAMHREGPRHGSPIRLGLAVAGTDALAVDAVAAALMGIDPAEVGHLVEASRLGLGTIDLDAIEIVGDPIATVRRRCVPHSNAAIVRRRPEAVADRSALSGPHRVRSRESVEQ